MVKEDAPYGVGPSHLSKHLSVFLTVFLRASTEPSTLSFAVLVRTSAVFSHDGTSVVKVAPVTVKLLLLLLESSPLSSSLQ